MRDVSVWREMLGLSDAVVEDVELEPERGAIVAHVRVRKGAALRCSRCRRKSPRYDRGEGRRRWRHLDAGTLRVFIEADVPRVRCRACGVNVIYIPWARAGAGHSVDFDRQVAYLATRTSKSAVVELIRIAWRTVGTIPARYRQDVEDCYDRYDGLRRIGIDEIAYKKGRKYLTVVVDHDTGRLVWAGTGRESATLEEFFEILGPARAGEIILVSADAARYIAQAVKKHLPNAVQCADPFHVIAWATDALDQVRREAWNTAKGRASNTQLTRERSHGPSRALKNTRLALWKNPEDLTEQQHAKIEWIAKTDPRLYRAYLLKEGLRYVFKVKGTKGREALDRWLAWAARCRIPAFIDVARRIKTVRASIDAALKHHLSNALIESVNTKIRLITRLAFGFADPEALIALALLSLGGYKPTLPGRT
ncbi:ISL3 family transposase [Actinospica robiniae]|uniref:ISL3 family transposase n=1 Tax=Actinospica robiniae TaxID=304901 RepID=UPI00042698FF|nr:ISL3 family transposase [Actinospica robiniae]